MYAYSASGEKLIQKSSDFHKKGRFTIVSPLDFFCIKIIYLFRKFYLAPKQLFNCIVEWKVFYSVSQTAISCAYVCSA